MAQSVDQILGDQPKPPRVYPRLNRKLLWLKWLALIGGVVMLGAGAYEYYNTKQLQKHGVAIEGTLVNSSTLNTGKGRTSYDIIVDYDPKESQIGFRKRFNVAEDDFNQAMRTGKTTVTYLPSNPKNSAIGRDITANTEPLAIGTGLLIVSAGVHFYIRRQMAQVERYLDSAM